MIAIGGKWRHRFVLNGRTLTVIDIRKTAGQLNIVEFFGEGRLESDLPLIYTENYIEQNFTKVIEKVKIV